MKVAIMGAGLSGLSCAITLEKQGIHPVVFEKRNRVGDRFVNAEAVFNILNKPYNNCLEYIKNEYGIEFKGINDINRVNFHSKNEVGSIKGNLGKSNIRGRHKDSFEEQLRKQYKGEIIYNCQYSYEELAKEFTHVVLATGDGAYSIKLNNYTIGLTATLKGATVEGNFDDNLISIWFNHEFAPKGYAYIIPYSDKEANIVISYPDYTETKERDLNYMWNSFYNKICNDMKQSLKITDRFEITRYIIGICKRPKIDNTYFVGNCFGAISPALGFGQFTSILTGIYAAEDMIGLKKYEEQTKVLIENYNNSLLIRKALESLSDNQLDFMIKNLDNKITDKLIDKIHSDETEFDLLKWASYVLKPFYVV